MTILANSRYVGGQSITITNADGLNQLGVARGAPASYASFLHYQCALGDRLDTVAFQFYGDTTLWWVIADANPQLRYPAPLVPGSIIAIPQGVALT